MHKWGPPATANAGGIPIRVMALEHSLAVPQNIKQRVTRRSSNSTPTNSREIKMFVYAESF